MMHVSSSSEIIRQDYLSFVPIAERTELRIGTFRLRDMVEAIMHLMGSMSDQQINANGGMGRNVVALLRGRGVQTPSLEQVNALRMVIMIAQVRAWKQHGISQPASPNLLTRFRNRIFVASLWPEPASEWSGIRYILGISVFRENSILDPFRYLSCLWVPHKKHSCSHLSPEADLP